MTNRYAFLDAARKYTTSGWVIHPLSSPTDKGASPGKRPLLKEWQKRGKATDEESDQWFSNTDPHFQNCNIGLACGKGSGVTLLDFDKLDMLPVIFPGSELKTKVSKRVNSREHGYFKYCPGLRSQKCHDLGVEVLGDGSNAVLPPSIHKEGQEYHWNDPEATLASLTEEQIDKIKAVMEFPALISKLRPCTQRMIKERERQKWHGGDGRERMLALSTELKACGGASTDAHILAALIYGKEYDPKRTESEWGDCDKAKPWKCDTLRRKFLEISPLCTDCSYPTEASKKRKQKYGKMELPPIPAEPVDSTPASIQSVVEVFKKYYAVQEDIEVTLPMAFVVGNFAPCDPDMLGIIGASGSAKTETLRAITESENQYAYMLSNITPHTFMSGMKDTVDLAPRMQGRLLLFKDWTIMLAQREDVRAQIFAAIRDFIDGNLKQDYGSGASKSYTNVHSSIMFASTKAIEQYYKMNSILGQRGVFFRPKPDRMRAARQARRNQGNEKEIRAEVHSVTMRFLKTVLENEKDGIKNIGKRIPEDMNERILLVADWGARARTHLERDRKGIVISLPDPEFPTRLSKSIAKIIDAHALIHGRAPAAEDEKVGMRVLFDSVPETRMELLKRMLFKGALEMNTTDIGDLLGIPTDSANTVLGDMKALGIIEHMGKREGEGNVSKWRVVKDTAVALLIVSIRGEIQGVVTQEGIVKPLYLYAFHNYNNIYKEDFLIHCERESIPVGFPPLIYQHAEAQSKNTEGKKEGISQGIGGDILIAAVEQAGREWEQKNGVSISSANMTEFCMWYCEHKDPSKQPSEIRAVAEKVFKITPEGRKPVIKVMLLKPVPRFCVPDDGDIQSLQNNEVAERVYQREDGVYVLNRLKPGDEIVLPSAQAKALIQKGAAREMG